MKHPDNAIKSNSPKKIWESLHFILGKTCKKESCWLRHKCLKENVDLSVLKEDFSPKAPEEWKKNPQEWLTSIEIIDFMKQYEKTYEDFEFLGPSPIDYDTHKAYGECVWEELCEFNLRDNLKNKKINQIYSSFENHLKIRENFIVGVSGGPDSLALAYLSKCYQIKKPTC